MEDVVESLMRQVNLNHEKDLQIQQQNAKIKALEAQMGQMAREFHTRPVGTLPSDTEVPHKFKGKEECKRIELRSGKILPENSKAEEFEEKDERAESSSKLSQKPWPDENEATTSWPHEEEEEPRPPTTPKAAGKSKQVERPYPPAPFPQRLKNKKREEQFSKFFEIFKKLHINIPFADALDQMPSYAKFMKDILTKKRKFGENETVALTEECSAILQKKLPTKLKDPGSFKIPINLGKNFYGNALCDLGASVNLMPLSVFNKLALGDLKPTTVTLQLADRSIKCPKGMAEDVLVKVGEFVFPVDFIVLDYEADAGTPILLGRPFLATSRALIDVEKGELKLRIQDEEMIFNVFTPLVSKDENTKGCATSKERAQFTQPVDRVKEKKEKHKEVANYFDNLNPSLHVAKCVQEFKAPSLESRDLKDYGKKDTETVEIKQNNIEEAVAKHPQPKEKFMEEKVHGPDSVSPRVPAYKPPWKRREDSTTTDKFGGVNSWQNMNMAPGPSS